MIEYEKKEEKETPPCNIDHTRKETDDKLDQLLKDLEEEWDSIKQSKRRALHRYPTDSNIIIETFQLMDKSPRNLMSSLQQRSWSPDESAWKVRNNDLAVMEILRERRAAIESGKLKGRRLFEEPEGVTEAGSGERESLCIIGWNSLNQDSEVRSACSYDSDDEKEGNIGGSEEEVLPAYSDRCSYSSSNSTSLCGEIEIAEREVKEEEKVLVAEVKEKTSVSGGKWMAALRWIFVVLIIVYAVVLGAMSMRSFFGYKDEDEVILVPT
ncbi:hypothetical protein ACOSQ3_000115 [Xanthoceras sorbifolium]